MRTLAGLGLLAAVLSVLAACTASPRPQSGGGSTTMFGGATGPTTVTTVAPQNPQTPSTTIVEKTTTREFAAAAASRPETIAAGLKNSISHATRAPAAPSVAVTAAAAPLIVREIVVERATTKTGAAQKDTARELGARLANMRGVMWVGVLLLIGGPIVGWKIGWFINGAIAGAVGLLLIILAQVVPGNEAWFGLAGLIILPLVGYVYYRAQSDGTPPPTPPSP